MPKKIYLRQFTVRDAQQAYLANKTIRFWSGQTSGGKMDTRENGKFQLINGTPYITSKKALEDTFTFDGSLLTGMNGKVVEKNWLAKSNKSINKTRTPYTALGDQQTFFWLGGKGSFAGNNATCIQIRYPDNIVTVDALDECNVWVPIEPVATKLTFIKYFPNKKQTYGNDQLSNYEMPESFKFTRLMKFIEKNIMSTTFTKIGSIKVGNKMDICGFNESVKVTSKSGIYDIYEWCSSIILAPKGSNRLQRFKMISDVSIANEGLVGFCDHRYTDEFDQDEFLKSGGCVKIVVRNKKQVGLWMTKYIADKFVVYESKNLSYLIVGDSLETIFGQLYHTYAH